ncbi:MAG: DNA recombination protein RmuC [Candidatus Omnitrophica bacterium]|nr:DNA recombination protein RmuC [Candidatus Omnitrophota bacterium]
MNVSIGILLGSVLLIVLFLGIAIFLFKEIIRKEVRQEFEFSRTQLQEKAVGELAQQKQAVENSVKTLREELDRYSKMVHGFEKDRDEKYGNLTTELKRSSQETARLQETTNHLTSILGNVKKRGEWGERMAEDIIQLCGLKEGVNYRKQKQGETGSKPDYTFLLPDKHIVNMDVKFPFNNYLNMVNAAETAQKDMFLKQFLGDVRNRIKEIGGREYISPADGTLDFVLLFIPNEQVFGFIQEADSGIMDMALKQKVILCSPFTLYATLSIIRQAFDNFYYEKSTTEIIETVERFAKTYDVFKERFVKLEDTINAVSAKYHEIQNTSFKELDTKVRKIQDLKKGQGEEPS